MDRHVEFATQLAHLVSLYASESVDHAAEKAALRAARGAAKHGAVDLSVVDGQLRLGSHDAPTDHADISALHMLFTALGVSRLGVPHHAKQEDIKHFAKQLGEVAAGRLSPPAFSDAIASHKWKELEIDRAVPAPGEAAPEAEEASDAKSAPSEQPPEASRASETATPGLAPMAAESTAPEPDEPATAADASAAAEPAAATEETTDAHEAITAPAEAAPVPEEELPPAQPLAERLPDAVSELAGPTHRELFERLITSSEPMTLRRLLEPVLVAIELTAREGQVAQSVRLLLAMFACETLAEDDEMRRQFFVTLRRLTKPTLIRAYAMLYLDAPESAAQVEQALARFAEDGAEAVADCIGAASNRATREHYLALLRRLPGTPDALLAMLDDDRTSVVERAVELVVAVQHPDAERVLGEALSHTNVRVRLAAARALSALPGSSFAADALLRAAQDAAPEVRLTGAVGLQARREERLATSVAPLVDAEEELDVQLALVTALGKLGTADAVQKLIALANPTERMLRRRRMPVLRLVAIEALGEARTPAAMVALQKLLEDREKDVREAAARLYTRARRQTAAQGMPAVS